MLFSPMAQPLLSKFCMSHSPVSANHAMSRGTLKMHVVKALSQSTRQGLKTFMKTLVAFLQTQWQLRNNNHTVKGLLLTLMSTLCPLKWPPLRPEDSHPLGVKEPSLLPPSKPQVLKSVRKLYWLKDNT
ncbi:hypothetical protein NC653_034011 [Populus alba x Populus x berolinensis]|uniref:Uncharacterized protein n=1 Tax=Populus alba x Populus x berolinensis TaxID=444605 RepID=A0AAD6LWB4_9ROSI|nr:hypothetical protein NC653_034011 [Populus alba x Populus x berolinensis]